MKLISQCSCHISTKCNMGFNLDPFSTFWSSIRILWGFGGVNHPHNHPPKRTRKLTYRDGTGPHETKGGSKLTLFDLYKSWDFLIKRLGKLSFQALFTLDQDIHVFWLIISSVNLIIFTRLGCSRLTKIQCKFTMFG